MFFPDRNYRSLYPDITPITTFPVIFNQFFDQDIALLRRHDQSVPLPAICTPIAT